MTEPTPTSDDANVTPEDDSPSPFAPAHEANNDTTDTDVETDPVTTDPEISPPTADEPAECNTGNKVWETDGKTFVEKPDGSVYETDGSHSATIVAVENLLNTRY